MLSPARTRSTRSRGRIGLPAYPTRTQIMTSSVRRLAVSAYRASTLIRPVGADIDQRHPEVKYDLFNWGAWILSTLGHSAAGFRFDAIKHIDEDFIVGFIKDIRQKSGQPNLFAVGEFWSDSVDDIFQYLDRFGTQVRSVQSNIVPWVHSITYIVQHLRRAAALQLQEGRRRW